MQQIEPHESVNRFNRRTFLNRGGVGFGAAALGTLLGQWNRAQGSAAKIDLPFSIPHHAPKIKRVIFLCMAGGPSHLETFDYKPELERLDGKPMPASFTSGQPIAQLRGQALKCLRPLTKFKPYGQSGLQFSDFLALPIPIGGRHLRRQIVGDRTDQSRPRAHLYEHWNRN